MENAQRKKLYDNVKNCIILSQTFFYLDENNNKVYIFELIKKNNWLRNPKFWRLFIDAMIKQEFIRFQKVFPENNFNVEENININKKIRDNLNEVVFAQLITFVTNMKDFEIDKRIIIKIIDEFIEKFNYLSDNHKQSIFEIISPDKEEIEKLRKEYNPSLEPELIDIQDDNDIIEELKEKINTHKVEQEEIVDAMGEINDKDDTKEENKENLYNFEDLENKENYDNFEVLKNKEDLKDEKKDDEENLNDSDIDDF